jgi:8-oxo-dGTP diphosphatase
MKRFNVRVYGILFNKERNAILISDEKHHDKAITKFIGGGLEFGEGSIDCLIREYQEELQIAIEVKSHFYTTDFFVSSAFDANSQVISIYYIVETEAEDKIVVQDQTHFERMQNGEQTLRWLTLNNLNEAVFTFPIDKKVATLLKQNI